MVIIFATLHRTMQYLEYMTPHFGSVSPNKNGFFGLQSVILEKILLSLVKYGRHYFYLKLMVPYFIGMLVHTCFDKISQTLYD